MHLKSRKAVGNVPVYIFVEDTSVSSEREELETYLDQDKVCPAHSQNKTPSSILRMCWTDLVSTLPTEDAGVDSENTYTGQTLPSSRYIPFSSRSDGTLVSSTHVHW